MNYFVEGLQGSGKSTFVKKLSEKYPEYRAFHEGDYSPVELAWCAYTSRDIYLDILDKYAGIKKDITAKSFEEDEHMIICYTQILTDIPGFHKDLEQYEIYNNRVSRDAFKNIILGRLANWNTDNNIFECSLFQNIVEDMILFQVASDEEIIAFYREIKKVLEGRDYHIAYLLSEDIRSNIDVIRKERSDDQGHELWFPLMLGYFNESPYAKENGLSGEEDMLSHFKHRQELELLICREVFPDRYTVFKSKNYNDEDIISDCPSRRIYEAVKKIPYGHVATYSQVAEIAGDKKMARAVGNALHKNPDPENIPCFRVVNAKGELAGEFAFGGPGAQAKLLEAEGIKVVDGKVDLTVFQWKY